MWRPDSGRGGGEAGVNELGGFGALQGQRAEISGQILQIHVGPPGKRRQLGAQPGGVRAGAGGVDDEEELLGLDLIDVEVVNRAAALVAHEGVLALAALEFADVVGQDAVEEFGSGAAAHHDFAHVGYVKQAGGGADGVMFFEDAGVMQGHFPAAEFNQAGAQFLMDGKEWRSLKHEISVSLLWDYIWFPAPDRHKNMRSPYPHFSTFICSWGTFRS